MKAIRSTGVWLSELSPLVVVLLWAAIALALFYIIFRWIDPTHELASQRKLPLFSGEFRKRSKCDFACCNGHGIKRADDDSMLHTVTLAELNAYFIKQVLPPRHEDN